jgi:diguanylate cyclase (GGDEF)-like protein
MKIKEHLLQDSDRIQIGRDTILKFNYLDALENTFNEELYNSANRDFLTGAYNKKYFLDRLSMELSFSKRHQTPLSLLFFDIDHFKKINDRHGHLAGDHILKEMVSKVRSEKRQEDLLARYGGEEFVLLLRETPAENAILIAEHMRESIKDHNFRLEQKIIPLTISVGISVYLNDNYNNPEEFIKAADSELYKAKNSGRNRTSCSKA